MNMKYEDDKHKNQMNVLFFISALILVIGNKLLTGTSYFISQVVAYILIIYSIYSGKIFSKKINILFIISSSLMLIGEVGSFYKWLD